MKEGWEYKKLDDICTIVGRIGFRGYTKADLVDSPNDGAITLSPSNITNGELDFSKCTYISWDKYNESPEIMLTKGDVVLVKTASIGKCAVVKELPHKATLNPQFVVLKGIIGEPNFIGYYLKSPVAQITIKQMAGGVAIPTLSQKKLGTMLIPSPSLSEQQSIVDYLDSAFAKIDAMKANAEKTLNEAKALFQASLKEMLEPKEGWEYKKLGEVCDFEGGSQPPKSEWINHPQNGYVRMLQIRDFTKSRNAEIEYVKITKKLRLCKDDDILIGRYGASVGKILTGLAGAYNVAIIKSIPNEELIRKDFIRRYFESSLFQSILFKVCTSRAAQAGFSKDDIKDELIPVPPLSEQQSIVATLDSLKSKVDTLQANYAKISQECDALKQAILRQVFE